MNDSKANEAAAEPPLDCRVGLDIACYRVNYSLPDWEAIARVHGEMCAPIGAVRAVNALCDEVERLRDELQLASDTARYACDGWNDALMHEGAHMAAKAIEARKVPNACGEPGLTEPGKD